MFTTAIIYDRKRQSEGGKDGTLELRITYNRKSYYINTGMRIRAKHWAGAIVGRPDADALNNRLRIIISRVNEKINEFIDKREPIDVAVIKEYIYDGTKARDKDDRLLTWIEKQIPMLDVSEGTRQHYRLLLNRLQEYGKLRAWNDVSVESIYEWDAWLRGLKNVNAKQTDNEEVVIGEGAVYNYHKYLKCMLNRAVAFGIIQASPYSRLVGKFKKPSYDDNTEYMTEEEMKVIIDLHPTPGTNVAVARDLFVFQLFTGLSYSDTQTFDFSQYKNVDGQWVHTGQRIKTGVPYVSVLLPPVIDVLERNNWQVPKINIDTYNYSLKTIGKVLGMERLHSHLARHTFATYMLSNNVKIQNVMRMLGHKNIRQTMKYAKVLAKDVQADYNMIAEKLK